MTYLSKLIIDSKSSLKSFAISFVAGILSGAIVAMCMRERGDINWYIVLLWVIATIIVSLLVLIQLNLKRIVHKTFSDIISTYDSYFGFTIRENQYFERRKHWEPEKRKLCKALVKDLIPRLIKEIRANNKGKIIRLRIVIDAGTTLTPAFSRFLSYDLPESIPKENITIYTNSISGIEEIHKRGYGEHMALDESNFYLFGGRPNSKYVGTESVDPNEYLSILKEDKEKNESEVKKVITLSLLTANWFLVGQDFRTISICARGQEHFNFKRQISEISDYIVLVAPLAKLFSLDNKNLLNEIISDYANRFNMQPRLYESFELVKRPNNAIYLLTTKRKKRYMSPLVNHSRNLHANTLRHNFSLCQECFDYKPPGDTETEVAKREFPHDYIDATDRGRIYVL